MRANEADLYEVIHRADEKISILEKKIKDQDVN